MRAFAEGLGHHHRHADVHHPGQRGVVGGAELVPGHEDDVPDAVVDIGQAFERGRDRAGRRRRHSTPWPSSDARRDGSVKRATPITRLPGAARLAMRARVGPILPPTPSTMMSPSTRRGRRPVPATAGVMKSSSAATSAKRSGRVKGVVLTGWHCLRRDPVRGQAPASSRRRWNASASRIRNQDGCSARAPRRAPVRHVRSRAPPGLRFRCR